MQNDAGHAGHTGHVAQSHKPIRNHIYIIRNDNLSRQSWARKGNPNCTKELPNHPKNLLFGIAGERFEGSIVIKHPYFGDFPGRFVNIFFSWRGKLHLRHTRKGRI